jgi:dihydrofolate reductase
MTKIKLFIAHSLDGFIARENGSLDWLENLPNPKGVDHGYSKFLADIDTILIARASYEEILGFGVDWPYPNCQTWVLTRQSNYIVSTPNTQLLYPISPQAFADVKASATKDIWALGGGKLISALLNLGLVDEMTLSVIPIVLGKGILLFPNQPLETKLELINTQSFETGVVNLHYRTK